MKMTWNFKNMRQQYLSERTILSVNLPFYVEGATPPRPDPSHGPSLAAGIAKRIGCQPPKVNRAYLRDFTRYVSLWCRRNLPRLANDQLCTFEEWLEETNYPQGRKDELTKTWNTRGRMLDFKRLHRVKCFVKDETYPSYKYPRAIMSRIDEAKCFYGPYVKVASDLLFAMPEFIKKVPVPDRPMVIRDALLDSHLDTVFTDYTSFESHFVQEMMEATQKVLFKHLFGLTDGYEILEKFMNTVLMGENKLIFKLITVRLVARRMSGEMDTSLSNGFTNLMVFKYLTWRNNPQASVKGFVEGDDGLFVVRPSSACPTKEQFTELGFTIEIEHTNELTTASFCGQVYDMDELIVVTDPLEVIARLGWTNKRYVMANEKTRLMLLKSRAYSFVYQYNGCPILSVLGHRLLELLSDVHIAERVIDGYSSWDREKLLMRLKAGLPEAKTPGIQTRRLVEKLYGVTVEMQETLEEQFRCIELGPCELACEVPWPDSWVDYMDRYQCHHLTKDPFWLNQEESQWMQKIGRLHPDLKVLMEQCST